VEEARDCAVSLQAGAPSLGEMGKPGESLQLQQPANVSRLFTESDVMLTLAKEGLRRLFSAGSYEGVEDAIVGIRVCCSKVSWKSSLV
jgi:hypothetical protein